MMPEMPVLQQAVNLKLNDVKFLSALICTKFYSRSHDAVIRVYDDAGNVIETHEHAGEFKNETLSIIAMCVSNPDRSPVGINR